MSESKPIIPFELKQPWEEDIYEFDLAPILRAGDEVSAIEESFAAPDGLVLTAPAVSGKRCQLRIAGGVDNTDYKVTVRVSTTLGAKKETEGEIRVRDL